MYSDKDNTLLSANDIRVFVGQKPMKDELGYERKMVLNRAKHLMK